MKASRSSATTSKTRVVCAQGVHDKFYRNNRMDWHTSSMPLPKDLDLIECRKIIRTLNGAGSAKLNQYSYKYFFPYFHRLSFQVQIEKKQTPPIVTKFNIVHTGVFTYQPIIYDWITSFASSNSRCKDDQENIIDKDSLSLIIETSVDYSDKVEKLIFEG